MAILHIRKDREQQEYMNKNARNLKKKKVKCFKSKEINLNTRHKNKELRI